MATPDIIEGFEWATTTNILTKWNIGSVGSFQTGRFSYGLCARINGTSLVKSLSSNYQYVGATCAIRIVALNAAPLLGFRSSGTVQCDLRMLSDGRVTITRNGTVLATSATALLTNIWYHLEFALCIEDALGTAEVKINEVTFVSFSGDTRQSTEAGTTGTANEFFLNGAGSLQVDYDDLCVYSGAGWLGDCRVYSLLPSGAGNYTQWTPSTGSNYTCVDETAPNSDTDYVSTTTAGNIDTYAYGDISGSGTVRALAVNLYARKDDAGARTICPVYRRSSTDTLGDNISLANGYVYYTKIWQTDPLTAAAWTLTNINASEFGVKLVS